jgi:hypothetical protein
MGDYRTNGLAAGSHFVWRTLVSMSLLMIAAAANASTLPAWTAGACETSPCLRLEYDPELAREAALLGETLRLRLCKHGVNVFMDAAGADTGGDSPPAAEPANTNPGKVCNAPDRPPGKPLWWVVGLKPVLTNRILVAVDHLGQQSEDDRLRDVARSEAVVETVWTLSLVIEEAVLPYLNTDRDLPPVGVGLAVSEPREVGGVKKSEQSAETPLPKLRSVGAGLGLYYAGTITDTVDDLLLGPLINIEGLLAPRVIVSFSIGWVGNARFNHAATQVKGSISYVPVNILFGYVMFANKYADISVLGGVSTGFSIIKTSSPVSDSRRTDFYFDPWLEAGFNAAIFAYGPLAIYLRVGVAFPIIRDVLENGGTEVYRQDWIMPFGGVGVQLWL